MEELFRYLFDPTASGNVSVASVAVLFVLAWVLFPKRKYGSSVPLRFALSGMLLLYAPFWVFEADSNSAWELTAFVLAAYLCPLLLLAGLITTLCKQDVTWRPALIGFYIATVAFLIYFMASGGVFIMS